MDSNTVSPLPPPEAPLAMMENEKTPPRSPGGSAVDMPPPPNEKWVEQIPRIIKLWLTLEGGKFGRLIGRGTRVLAIERDR